MSDKNRGEDEEPDHDAMGDELVTDNRLQEQSQQGEDEDVRKGDEVKLFEVLKQFVMVVARARLAENAADHHDGEQQQLNDRQGSQFGEPVDRLPHGQRIVNAVELDIAFTPDQLAGIERRDDEEEKS